MAEYALSVDGMQEGGRPLSETAAEWGEAMTATAREEGTEVYSAALIVFFCDGTAQAKVGTPPDAESALCLARAMATAAEGVAREFGNQPEGMD